MSLWCPRVCLVRLERRENWGVVEALATHRSPSKVSPGGHSSSCREQRQFDENSLHNKHNIVNFLLKVCFLSSFMASS